MTHIEAGAHLTAIPHNFDTAFCVCCQCRKTARAVCRQCHKTARALALSGEECWTDEQRDLEAMRVLRRLERTSVALQLTPPYLGPGHRWRASVPNAVGYGTDPADAILELAQRVEDDS